MRTPREDCSFHGECRIFLSLEGVMVIASCCLNIGVTIEFLNLPERQIKVLHVRSEVVPQVMQGGIGRKPGLFTNLFKMLAACFGIIWFAVFPAEHPTLIPVAVTHGLFDLLLLFPVPPQQGQHFRTKNDEPCFTLIAVLALLLSPVF